MKCGPCLREVTVWLFHIPADCSWRMSPELWFLWLQGLECSDGAKKSLWWATCSSEVKLKKGLCELPSDLTVFITPLPAGDGGLEAKSCSALATPWSVACQAPLPWDSPGKNTGMGCHFLLQNTQLSLFKSKLSSVHSELLSLPK